MGQDTGLEEVPEMEQESGAEEEGTLNVEQVIMELGPREQPQNQEGIGQSHMKMVEQEELWDLVKQPQSGGQAWMETTHQLKIMRDCIVGQAEGWFTMHGAAMAMTLVYQGGTVLERGRGGKPRGQGYIEAACDNRCQASYQHSNTSKREPFQGVGAMLLVQSVWT